MEKSLPAIPAKRYFTIGEVGDLCGVKPHVLRYWEQEFTQLRPVKRRGNRRYYQHHEVLMIRRIRELLYDQGFTISGARNRLQETVSTNFLEGSLPSAVEDVEVEATQSEQMPQFQIGKAVEVYAPPKVGLGTMRAELFALKHILTVDAIP